MDISREVKKNEREKIGARDSRSSSVSFGSIYPSGMENVRRKTPRPLISLEETAELRSLCPLFSEEFRSGSVAVNEPEQ